MLSLKAFVLEALQSNILQAKLAVNEDAVDMQSVTVKAWLTGPLFDFLRGWD